MRNADNAIEYKIYDNSIRKNASLTLLNENSTKLKDTDQLVKLGMIRCSDEYVGFVSNCSLNNTKIGNKQK